MTTRLTFPASMFSVVCQRCGSTMRKNADSCPTCGADRNAAFGRKDDGDDRGARKRGNMFEQTSSQPFASAGASASASLGSDAASGGADEGEPTWGGSWNPTRASERIARKAAEHRTRQMMRVEKSARSVYADRSNDPDNPDALPGSDKWSQRKTVIAGACALALLTGAVFYLQYGGSADDTSPSADHSVSGSIDSKFGALTHGSSGTTTSTIAPAIAERHAQTQARAIASGDALTGLRLALDQHDLTAARGQLKIVTAQQQTRPEYAPMKDELVKHELQRDAALQLARACERTSAWSCVQQNAVEALALDIGNTESQAMLEKVIEHAGWASNTSALAKKALTTPPPATTPNTTSTANAAKSDLPTQTQSSSLGVAPVQVPGAQGNVAVTTPAVTPPSARSSAAQRAADRRATQHGAMAAHQPATDDTHADSDSLTSRADRLARAQAATNALTAATVGAPSITGTPSVPVMPTPGTSSVAAATPTMPRVTNAPAVTTSPQAAANTTNALTGTTAAQAAPGATNPATAPAPRAPQYIGDTQGQPASPHGPQYLGQTPAQQPAAPAAPAAQSSTPHAPRYLEQSPIQPSSTGSQQMFGTNGTTTAPHATTAAARPLAQRVPVVSAQAATTTQAAPRPAVTSVNTVATTATLATTPTSAHIDGDKTEALERAIKQYGWSGSDTMPKPSE